MYFCGLMAFYPDPWFFVRVDPARGVPVTALREAMREIEPQRAVYQPRTMTAVLTDAASQPRLNAVLFVFFGATALLLVSIGLHGMLAQVVADRTREIGVRLALGARPAQVLAQILGQSAMVTLVGLAVGLAGAFATVRFMSALVFAISSRDPVTFIAAPVLLAIVALAATIVPARRAARIDPLVSLRSE
jgi:putative ABC transport system permease protein